MTIAIRAAIAADKEACIELLQDFATATGEDLSAAAGDVFDNLLQTGNGEILVAEDDGELLGLVSLTYTPVMRFGAEYCRIEELVVDPSRRGEEVGARLVEGAIGRARGRGCAEIGTDLLERAAQHREFHARLGFDSIGTALRRPVD